MARPRRVLTLVTGPAADVVTLGEAKAWAKVDGTDDDPLIASLITAATQSAEQYLRRALVTQTYRLTLDQPPSILDYTLGDGVYDLPVTELYGGLPREVELPMPPILTVSSVKTYDTANASSTYSSGNYALLDNRLVLNRDAVWPTSLRARAALEINYTAGYGATSSSVPGPIKTAVLMHAQQMYDGRTLCDVPEGCKQLLRQYRIADGLAA